MTPSFTDLTYFYEIAKQQNLSRAAKSLRVTQPSLSMAINRLEKSFDTPLFIRHHKGVTLTQSGERLLLHVSDLIARWHKTANSIDMLSEEVNGKVSIGCHASVGAQLSGLTAGLLDKYPHLEIQFHHELPSQMTEQVLTGKLDLAMVYDPIHYPDLILKKMRDIELAFWRVKNGNINSDVIVCDTHLTQVQTLLKFYESKQSISRLCHANDFEMIARLTISGTGIGILPACFVGNCFTDKLERVQDTPSYVSEMFLIYRCENINMQAREVVLNALKNLVYVSN